MLGLDVILGGVTGLVGNIVTGIMNYKTMKVKNEHEQKMVGLNTNAMLAKAKMQIEITKNRIAGEVELADSEAYKINQEKANEPSFSEKWIDKLFAVEGKVIRWFAITAAVLIAVGFGFVDWLRGFMRPAITMYLTAMTTVVTWMAWDILQAHGLQTMTVVQALEIYNQVIDIVIYLTVTCVTWWFGDRRMAKFLTSMDKRTQKGGK
jgi:hypothetical protein